MIESIRLEEYLIMVAIFLQIQSWYHYYGTGEEPKITLTLTTLLVVMFALGLAIGVVLAVGALLYFQVGKTDTKNSICPQNHKMNVYS